MTAEPDAGGTVRERTSLDFSAVVEERLAEIEAALRSAAEADTPLVTEAAQHVIAAGGKRFRPMLVVLASSLGPRQDPDAVVKAATVVELTHVASLYHDDVMDEAVLRRGSPSANDRWGNTVAILVGDYLFARASDLVAQLGPDYVQIQAQTFARLVQGQIAETVGPAEGEDPLQHYLDVLAGKTGALIATSALFGAMVADADPDIQQRLARFGEEIGLVFQLSDDIIDITSDDTGKTPGTDLRAGIPTLPTLLLRGYDAPADRRLRESLDGDLRDDETLAAVLAELRKHPVIDEARAQIGKRAESARALLEPLPPGPAKSALTELCDTVVTRTA